ncbi:hypothetical protein G7Y89_g2975 [Cudoniella acicularis]|uniref:Uncharacterized protein n=1 Tax=Cudoniella acicularis TaxID=354080 RepID=A0A8H4RUD4_9HELO|nr:hypothetical protein G7Y89_g2975 [Cudoniella acicularis]
MADIDTANVQNLSITDAAQQLSTALEEYRETVIALNRATLTRELQDLDGGPPIDINSEDPDDVERIVAELWHDNAWTANLKARVQKVEDFFAPGVLSDGTLPPYPAEVQGRILANLETALNSGRETEDGSSSAQQLVVPAEYKTLLTLVGGLTGPGLPMHQETSVTAAVQGLVARVLSREELDVLVQIRLGEGWEITAGWQCGSSMYGGGSYVVYCQCVAEPATAGSEDSFAEWAWRYLFVPGMDEGLVFHSLVEFIKGYLEWYQNAR